MIDLGLLREEREKVIALLKKKSQLLMRKGLRILISSSEHFVQMLKPCGQKKMN